MAEVYTGNEVELILAPEAIYGTEGTYAFKVRAKSATMTPRHDMITNAEEFNGVAGATQVNGADVRHVPELEISKNLNAEDSYLFLTAMGDTADSTLEAGVGQHIIDSVTLGDYDIDSSLSLQKNDVADVKTNLGMKVYEFEISGNSDNNEIMATYKLTGREHKDNDGSWDGSALSYKSTVDFFWKDMTVAMADDSLNSKITAFSLKGANLANPEFASTGTKYTVEPQPKGFAVTGSITAWYESSYLQGLYTSGTLFDLAFTFEAATLIGATKYPKLIAAMGKVRITETPTVQANFGERQLITFNFEAFADTANSNKILTVTIQDTNETLTKHS